MSSPINGWYFNIIGKFVGGRKVCDDDSSIQYLGKLCAPEKIAFSTAGMSIMHLLSTCRIEFDPDRLLILYYILRLIYSKAPGG